MTQSGSEQGRKSSADPSAADASDDGLFEHAGLTVEKAAPRAPVSPPGQASPDGTASKPRKIKVVDDKTGHRERLRERFRDGGPDAVPDYELLEMILFRVYSRGDTKPLAKALITKFKNFSEVINAPPERLMEIEGIGQRAVDELKLVRAAALRMMRGQTFGRPLLGTWNAVLDYCKAVQAYDEVERFRILFLDKRNQLLEDEVQQTGTVDHTPVYVREVVKRGLQLGATALILVHNHPSGDPTPSSADITMTKMIVDAARPLGITIHDHVIVGRHGHYSLKANKQM